MGTKKLQNSTTFIRCPKEHLYNIVPINLYALDGYQFAIMAHIISNKDGWVIVKEEIRSRVKISRPKFNCAWQSLCDLGYIVMKRTQGGYHYTIYEDPSSTSVTGFITATGGIYENSTTTAGATCAGGILTNTNNNYNKEFTSTTSGTCEKDQFNELLELYPDSGTNQDGTTYPTKGKLDECFKAYTDYLKTKQMTHEEIMTALKVELQDRRNHGRTNYQPGLPKWIDRKDFEDYRGRSVEPNVPGYGETLE